MAYGERYEKDKSKCRPCSVNQKNKQVNNRLNWRGAGEEPPKRTSCKKEEWLKQLVISLKNDVRTICEYESRVARCPVAGVPSFEPCRLLSDMLCKLSQLEKLVVPCPQRQSNDNRVKKLRMAAVLLRCSRNMLCRQMIKENQEAKEKRCKMVALLRSLACVERHLEKSSCTSNFISLSNHSDEKDSHKVWEGGSSFKVEFAKVEPSKPNAPVWFPGANEICTCYEENMQPKPCCPEEEAKPVMLSPAKQEKGLDIEERMQAPLPREDEVVEDTITEEITGEDEVVMMENIGGGDQEAFVDEVGSEEDVIVEEVTIGDKNVIAERFTGWEESTIVQEFTGEEDKRDGVGGRGLEITSFKLTYTKRNTKLVQPKIVASGEKCGCCTDDDDEEDDYGEEDVTNSPPITVYRRKNEDGGYTTYKGQMGRNINFNIEHLTENKNGEFQESLEVPPAEIVDLEERVKEMSWIWYESARQLCDQVLKRVKDNTPPPPPPSPASQN